MASVIIKLRIMPESPEIDLTALTEACKVKVAEFGIQNFHSVKEEPVAFGLKALDFIFLVDEKNSNTDVLEEKVREVKGVQSTQILDVRRAIG